MALVCNIDQRGRAHRYRVGFVLVPFGVILGWVTSRFADGWLPWVLGGICVVGGLFSWFEANRGWCVARAMGFKTRF